MSYATMESEEQERKLFVGGLNKAQTDEESLRSFFIKYGGIIDCTIMRDNDKQSRGFGFVLFEHSSSVDEIIASRKEGKAFTLDDHHIEVKRALPKVPGGSAGSSRGGGLYRKIFVGGLPSTITDDELRKYFERFGRVTETELLRDRETNRLRGFAFITFDDEDSADKCIQRRTHEICKKLCEVKRAQTRSTLNKYEDDDFHRGGRGFRPHDSRDDRHSSPTGPQPPTSLGINEVNQLIQQAFIMGQQSVMNHTGSFTNYGEGSLSDNDSSISYRNYYNNKDGYHYQSVYALSSRQKFRSRNLSPQKRLCYEDSQERLCYEDSHNVSEHQQKGVQPPTAASLLSQLQPAQYPPAPAANPLLQALIAQGGGPTAPTAHAPSPIAPPSAPAANPQAAGGNTQALNQLAQLLQGRGIDPNALTALLKPEDRPQGAKNSTNGAYSTTYPSASTYDMYYNQSNSSTSYGTAKEEPESKRYRPY